MPNHIHTIWTLPERNSDYLVIARVVAQSIGSCDFAQGDRKIFTAKVPAEERLAVWGSRANKQEQAIWQCRFLEHRIRDERDFANHVQYIHYNPQPRTKPMPP